MAEALKKLYSQDKIAELSNALKVEYPDFDAKGFLKKFQTDEWKNAELKARVRFITLALHEFLPDDYSRSIGILKKVSRKFKPGFFSIFFPDFVEVFGQKDWDVSMDALEEFTQTSSAEFAIRPFIVNDPKRAIKQMLKWSKSPNHHLRRLSSEGCRSRLPWSFRLNMFVEDPSPVLPILENLKNDPELYVRKSVANHLNDISKDHPELILGLAEKWIGKSDNTDWIVNHALRTLLKSGNKRALKLFGHHKADNFKIDKISLNKSRLHHGDVLNFSFNLINSSSNDAGCRLEYAIDYMKANGSITRKVFQISKSTVKRGATGFARTCKFDDLSTRKHHPGKHTITILVNGEPKSAADFVLVR